MKLYARNSDLARVLETLIRVPVDVRRLVADGRVAVAVIGPRTQGMCMQPVHLGGAAVIALMEDAPAEVLAHELGHVVEGHEVADEQAEREAALQAGSWGFQGGGADPDLVAKGFNARVWAHPPFKVVVEADVLAFACRFHPIERRGRPCRAWAPVVPETAAVIGVGCDRESCGGWVLLVDLAEVMNCSNCGGPASVTWTALATPAIPVARWVCACGTEVVRRIVVGENG